MDNSRPFLIPPAYSVFSRWSHVLRCKRWPCPAEEVISRHLVTSVLLKTCTAAPPGNWRITFCYHDDTIKVGRHCLCSGGICHLYVYLMKGVYLVCRVSANVSAPHRLCNVMTENAAARKDRQRYGAALKVKPDVFFYQSICRGFSRKGLTLFAERCNHASIHFHSWRKPRHVKTDRQRGGGADSCDGSSGRTTCGAGWSKIQKLEITKM